MEEKFLHYIWQYKFYNQEKFVLSTGEKIEILNPGEYNTNSGPDFLNSKIKIGQTTWAGNIEIHINASDWYEHNHNVDKAYNNVILHVVFNNNKDIYRKNKELIPCIEINFYKSVFENYKNLLHQKTTIKCQNKIAKLDTFYLNNWIDKLAIERLTDKSLEIEQILSNNLNNWEDTFYQVLAKSFGLKINTYPFELLAKNLENKILAKHKTNLFQLEALLFGQAGFLNQDNGDEYYIKLKKEYFYLQKKYKLSSIKNELWKFMRLRPGNFPTVRIAQFAGLIYKSSGLFSKIINCNKIQDFKDLFEITTTEYWKTHYIFNKTSKYSTKSFGESAIKLVMINTIIPLLFTYGKNKNNEELIDFSLRILEELKAENNSIIRKWQFLEMEFSSSYQTQAIIQLNNEYCIKKGV